MAREAWQGQESVNTRWHEEKSSTVTLTVYVVIIIYIYCITVIIISSSRYINLKQALPYNLEVLSRFKERSYPRQFHKKTIMDAEAAALLKENPCSTCKKEVLEDQEVLLYDLCEW